MQGLEGNSEDGHLEAECDVVVVGSGAGGGVAASLLARTGAKVTHISQRFLIILLDAAYLSEYLSSHCGCLQVIVVEKGRYTRAAELSLLERNAFEQMYEGCGLATTDDAGEHPQFICHHSWLLRLA